MGVELFPHVEAATVYGEPEAGLKRLLVEIWHQRGRVETSVSLWVREGSVHVSRGGVQGEIDRLRGLCEAWLLVTCRWTNGANPTDLAIQMATHEVLDIDLKDYQAQLDSIS